MNIDFPPKFFYIGWTIWVVYFLVLEYVATQDPTKGDTFSSIIWRIMFIDWNGELTRPRPVFYYVIVGLIIWLFMHFSFNGRYG